MRRVAGELTESRDADSTLEEVNIGARKPGERELRGKKILMGKVYSRAVSDVCCRIPAREKCRLPFDGELKGTGSSFLW